jgi:hypothetical protein
VTGDSAVAVIYTVGLVVVSIAVLLWSRRGAETVRYDEEQDQGVDEGAADGIDPQLRRVVAVVAIGLLVVLCVVVTRYLAIIWFWRWWFGW